MIIYKIKNVINGKIYIGKTKHTLERRWYFHVWEAMNNNTRRPLLHAIKKYGEKSFVIQQINHCLSLDDLNYFERYYIDLYQSNDPLIGYNLTSGGDGGHGLTGKNHPLYGIKNKKLSDLNKSRKGIKLSKEHVEKIRNNTPRQPISDLAKKRIGAATKSRWMRGVYSTEIYIQKIRDSKQFVDYSFLNKKVFCNENNKEYCSIKTAAKELGIKTPSNISAHLNGKLKHVCGLTFKRI